VVGHEIEYETAEGGILRLPDDWFFGLDGMPGVDRERRALRFTRDRATLHDVQGRSLAFLGRAHPVVRRAISHAQRADDATEDRRVSVAHADANEGPAILLTFSAELRSVTRIEFRWIIAVHLPMRGKAAEIGKPEHWMRFAASDREASSGDVWHKLFASWVAKRRPKAEAVAAIAMQREASRLAAGHDRVMEQEVERLESWLCRRADDICGPFVPQTGDLFGAVNRRPDWQSLSAPLDRLAAFAADADNAPALRREAHTALELFQRRSIENTGHATLFPPELQPIGMLMLTPFS
jgi:hypothetical protein